MQRLPMPALRPFVALLWANETAQGVTDPPGWCEHALPSGAMHLVVRLTDSPLRIGEPWRGQVPVPVAPALVGGARSRFYLRELQAPSCSVGAVLRPGAAACLFGVPADALAERHTDLQDLWGTAALQLRERLLALRYPYERLALFESVLAIRLPRVHGLHPAVADALARFPLGLSVAAAVRHSGVSHRRFVALFRHEVGLAPKTYLRVQRFQRSLPALRAAGEGEGRSLADLAVDMGYSDQSHFNRDFLAFSGSTPQAYRRDAASAGLLHLRVADAGAR